VADMEKRGLRRSQRDEVGAGYAFGRLGGGLVVGCLFGCRLFQPLQDEAALWGWHPRACGELLFV
jgi:hypothetical protein